MAEAARQQPTFDAPLIQHPPPTAARRPEPASPSPSQPAPPRVFVADRVGDGDAPDVSPALTRLAELVAHRGTEGPFAIGILGPPGSGKSGALRQILADATALSQAAGANASPYVTGLIAVHLTGADLAADAHAAIAEQMHQALSRATPEVAAAAADDANRAAIDPHARLHALSESLDAARRRLDAERRARDEAESRRARLTETILYESGNSRVDAYARSNRASLESTLASFGFTKGDPIATYKGLVSTLADAGGPAARAGASLRSLWAYPGQTKRIVWAILLFALAWGVGTLGSDQSWLNSLGQGDTAQSVASQVRSHVSWFSIARQLLALAGVLCLAACAWRAFRFSRPLLHGASLVDADVSTRRGELDNLVAHHAQRVEALVGETDTLARRTTEAERRAIDAHPATPAFLASDATSDMDRARKAYFAHVDAHLVHARSSRDAKGNRRIIVALDDLDALAPTAVMGVLERASASLRGQSFGLIAAFDADRLVAALGPETREALARVVQVSYRVGAGDALGWTDVITRLSAPRTQTALRAYDATRSALDAPLHEAEQQMLATLAPLAGPAPRGVKRFVNAYRLGRQDATDALAAFAFALALAIGGSKDEKDAFALASRTGDGANALPRGDVGRLPATLAAMQTLLGQPITIGDARRAKTLADRWSLTA